MPAGSAASHCATYYAWSPDSRHFLTASLAPRMNVDNNLKVCIVFMFVECMYVCMDSSSTDNKATAWLARKLLILITTNCGAFTC